MEKNQITACVDSVIVSYEIVNSQGEYVTSYSADLCKNTNGLLDGLKLAKDAIRCKPDYKIVLLYKNGYRQESDL
jgi:hypothetical protein